MARRLRIPFGGGSPQTIEPMKEQIIMSYRISTIVIAAVFTLAASTLDPEPLGAAQSRGAKAGTHMSDKGRANTNAQWMADPEKGWVRAEGRHQLRDEKQENAKSKGGKRHGNGQKKTY